MGAGLLPRWLEEAAGSMFNDDTHDGLEIAARRRLAETSRRFFARFARPRSPCQHMPCVCPACPPELRSLLDTLAAEAQ
eukprot:5434918-Prymnesium_polylepis.1